LLDCGRIAHLPSSYFSDNLPPSELPRVLGGFDPRILESEPGALKAPWRWCWTPTISRSRGTQRAHRVRVHADRNPRSHYGQTTQRQPAGFSPFAGDVEKADPQSLVGSDPAARAMRQATNPRRFPVFKANARRTSLPRKMGRARSTEGASRSGERPALTASPGVPPPH